MIRKQIYIDRRHNALLKRLAKARQVSEAEVIRQALDREALMVSHVTKSGADPAAWAILQQAIDARRALGQQGAPYRWRRADAYEEREARFEKFAHREADA